jgi:serine/threonine protein kinase
VSTDNSLASSCIDGDSPHRPVSNIQASNVQSKYKTADFQVLNVAGKGSFGIVRKVKSHKDGLIYAIKTIALHADKVKTADGSVTLPESEILNSLPQHPNIIQMYGSFLDFDFGSTEQHKERPEKSRNYEETPAVEKVTEDDIRSGLF